MPRTLSFPPPSTATCPICSAPLSDPRCGTCGAAFSGADGATLWRVDHDLFDLCRIRNDVVHRLLTEAEADVAPAPAAIVPPAPPRPTVPSPLWVDPVGVDPWSAAAVIRGESSMPDPDDGTGRASTPPPPAPPRARPPRPRPSFTAAEVLVGLGALSLVAAVAVFAAVSWSDLAAWAQGSLIVGLTGAVLATAVACRRRELIATAESLGAVGVALGLADVQVARVGLEGLVPDRWAWAVGIGLVAAGTITLGRRSGIRSLGLAGGALAFAPLVVAASGDRPLAWIGALALQAVIGGVVAARRADRRPDRAVAVVGASLSWIGAVVGAVGLAAAGLAADPVAGPIGPALVLAALAAASVIGPRRLGPSRVADLVGGAGAALAFGPALLLALGFGSAIGVLAVAAAQAVLALALALAGSGRATRGERAVAVVGGMTCWAASAAGLLAVAGARLIDDPATVPLAATLVLGALAVGSIAVARWTDDDEVAPVLGGAGGAMAFAPGLLLAAGTGSVLTVLVVAAAQAVVALALVASGRLTAAERGVAGVGGVVCWLAAAVGGGAVGWAQVFEGTSPVGASVVLGGLAVGSIVLGRWSDDELADVLGGAGVVVALAPALLLAAGTGSVLTVLAVAAVQAVVALALAGGSSLAGGPLLTPPERAVAVSGGSLLWVVGAAGALLHAVAEIVAATDQLDGRTGALLVLGGLAAASLVVGSATAQVRVTAAGAGLAFLPVPLAVLGVTSPSVLVAVLLGQALVAALLATVVERGPIRSVVVSGGATAWVAAVGGAGVLGVVGWFATPVQGPAGTVALLVALAALAVGASLRSGWDTTATGAGLGAAVVPVLLAVGLAAGGLGPDGWVAAVLAGAAALAVGLGLLGRVDGDRPWAAPSGVALVAGSALVVVPARTALAVTAALVDRATTSPDVGAHVLVVDWLRPALAPTGLSVPGWAAVAQVAGAAVLAGAVALLHRRTGRVLGALVAAAAILVVPVAAGLSVAVTVAGLGLVVLAAGAVVRLRPRDPELLGLAAAIVLVGTGVAVGSAPWTVGWTVLVGLVVSGLTVEVVARRSPDAPVWVGAAVGVVLAGVALDAWVLGAAGRDGLLAVAVAAAVLSPVAVVLERRGTDVAADVVDVLVGIVLLNVPLAALAVSGTVFSLSPFLALVGVTAAGAALRPRRRSAWLVATASAVLLAWVQAGRVEVDVIEAYTLPLALWALLVGGVVGRRLGSWERFGVGLLAAAGPTTVLALVDPDPIRTVVVVAVGAALAVWGAAARLQAPLAVGAAAVGMLAVRHLGPVGIELPRYVTFAVAGLVLLAVGATFEQRRQDLREARDAFVRLR